MTHDLKKIPIGVSSCLLGQEVRFDGGHKHDRYLTKTLSEYFEYVPFCPELAAGLGVPRETLRLSKNKAGKVWVETNKGHEDLTALMDRTAAERAKALPYLAGYILKSKSPSCGMERVKVYNASGMPEHNGVGRFTLQLKHYHPLLPIEEEGRLCAPLLRENFIKRVFAYHDWCQRVKDGLSVNKLIDFHSRYKYLLILHHYGQSKILGRLVAEASDDNLQKIQAGYIELFMETLKRLPSRRHHGQVLHRLVGSINQSLEVKQRSDVLQLIKEYLEGIVPLAVPVRMIRHHLTHIDEPYIAQQVYLNPYPVELGLMNHI